MLVINTSEETMGMQRENTQKKILFLNLWLSLSCQLILPYMFRQVNEMIVITIKMKWLVLCIKVRLVRTSTVSQSWLVVCAK